MGWKREKSNRKGGIKGQTVLQAPCSPHTAQDFPPGEIWKSPSEKVRVSRKLPCWHRRQWATRPRAVKSSKAMRAECRGQSSSLSRLLEHWQPGLPPLPSPRGRTRRYWCQRFPSKTTHSDAHSLQTNSIAQGFQGFSPPQSRIANLLGKPLNKKRQLRKHKIFAERTFIKM